METLGYRFVSAGGLLVMLALAYLMSENRRKVSVRVVAWGLGLQFALAVLILRWQVGRSVFEAVDAVFLKLLSFSDQGATFLFGQLATDPSYGATVAFRVLPVIVFVSSLSAVLYHLRVIQVVVGAMARLMHRTMRVSGVEALAAALLVFMGIESVTAIREYISRMTRSELFVVMTAFLATIASSVMAVYVMFGASAGHLLAASLMSAPAAVVIAKIMVPETGEPVTAGRVEFEPAVESVNVVDAAATGAVDGLKLALSVGAMLLAFVAMVALVNAVLAGVTSWVVGREVTLQELLGWAFAPFAAAMGVPRGDWFEMGQLLGIKTALNEFLAYSRMQEMVGAGALSARSTTIATYALCGFANPGSLGILIGGISGVAPERRGEVALLSIRALAAGTLAAFMTACYAGILA